MLNLVFVNDNVDLEYIIKCEFYFLNEMEFGCFIYLLVEFID